MRVLVIISRDLEKGSTKYRIAQYVDFLESRGIRIEFVKRGEIRSSFLKTVKEFDHVFNQRCLMRSSLSKKILTGRGRKIFDFDDAIYTRPGSPHSLFTAMRVRHRLHQWLRESDIVTTANSFLADYARRFSSLVIIVPMAVNTDVWKPAENKDNKQIRIGWAGAPVNIPNIERIGPVLSAILKKYPSLKLAVFSGEKPRLSCPFEYHPFKPGAEPDFVRSLDIGLLPLPEEEYSKGKSPIKAIQYLSCGIPVIGNVLGATAEILNESTSIAVSTDDDWLNALESLINDHDWRNLMGDAGRKFVLKHHNMSTVGEQLLQIFLSEKDGLQAAYPADPGQGRKELGKSA